MKSDTQTNLTDLWEFHKGDLGGIWEACRPVKKGDAEDALLWERVSLPHCFNALDAVAPDATYYQGPGWYRRTIKPENPFPGGRTLLHFEGAGQDSQVYIGQRKAGEHRGGYDEWKVDITDFLSESPEEIRLSVRCDNGRDVQRIPSDLSDFTIYGGLYRTVKLLYEPEVYIKTLHITPLIEKEDLSAELHISAELNRIDRDVRLTLEILDPAGAAVWSERTMTSGHIDLKKSLSGPALWSPENPQLYSARITLEDKESRWRQTYSERFGFRSFEFRRKGPFFLNGGRLLLKGTHRHEDHAGLGAVMPPELIGQEMRMIKAMGANFIRLGHYQQSTQVLDLCDSLGLLVWEEIPWCRGGLGNESYREMGRTMLKNMIEQHYNHPSVIIWGLGNENDWPGDFEDFDETAIRQYMNELHELSHRLDNTRMTAIRRCDFCKDIPDIYSPSIWAGWYRGHYREYKEATLKHIGETERFFHAEWGASSHSGRFSEDPYEGLEHLRTGVGTDERGSDASLYGGISRVSKDGNWSENYACDLFDWTLKEQETMADLTGSAFWPFKDFATPLRPENPLPYVNQKGVVERDLTPKESFYVVQSFWSNVPMIRIFGHNWTDRWGGEKEEKEFRVYSNCRRVELFLDGRSLGVKTRDSQDFPAAGLRWTAELSSGIHELRALAVNEELEDHISFAYHSEKWGNPAVLLADIAEEDSNTYRISVKMTDGRGKTCLDYGEYVYYSLAGKGQMIRNLGTVRGSEKVQMCNGKSEITVKAEKGSSVLVIRSGQADPLFLEL
ncbi:glycoside hydrolase family 2 protein [Spirochaeta isovalerica]|uniref:Beta-galactosidase n=1 Tax=Spirochaeta isovalerica TaxID=150 RepID=A0A841R869_9SPIO|nr:glycoside hydrolase family 2 TIM barrel-domain containing protein [Spirochaeta isovalerica]MBB6480016.1 beta-galactosidase [Spirochaeta isovalerica]